MFTLHYDEPREEGGPARLPVTIMSSIRVSRDGSSTHLRHGKHHHIQKLIPKHYFQLSPPTTNDHSQPWSWPIIHIVSTRFMQGQGTLVHLARSRLKLLEVICLPSLMAQTIFNHDTLAEVYEDTKWEREIRNGREDKHKKIVDPIFLWIIKVDPNLDKTVLNELKAVLEPVKRFTLVVGSNTNYGIGIKPGGWRDGQAGQNILDAYENGNVYFPGGDSTIQMIRRAHEAREDRVVLETRLDADDAINVEYVASLQRTALTELVDPHVSEFVRKNDDDDNDQPNSEDKQIQPARWLYWCPGTHVQWNPASSANSPHDDPGMLQVFRMAQTCVTAGLSLGFAVGTQEENVARYEHSKIYWEINVNHNNEGKQRNITQGIDKHDCGLYPSSRCAVFVEDPKVSAFRSRTLTSAGMHNIEAQGVPTVETPQQYKEFAAKLWQHTIEHQFGIKTERAKEAADFMLTNYLGTVRDNLRGQCTHGHSCKLSSLEKLQRTIDILEQETGGVEILVSNDNNK
ncbi:hypothetical protein ACHAXR_009355 [Thalassiosira sp. AJA248-18]